MGDFKQMVKMETTEPSVILKLKKGGSAHKKMKHGGDADHKPMQSKMNGGIMGALSGATPVISGTTAAPVARMPMRPSMSSRRNSRKEEAFSVDDVTALEVEQNVVPKVDGTESVLAPHMTTLLNHGIVVTKVFSDNETGLVYLDCYSKIGTNFVVEIENRPGVSLYLNDGHVLEKHTGEELELSKRIVQAECDKLGECGLFSQHGDKVVVASKKAGSLHKTSYIVSTEGEKSILEDHHVVAVPVIKFEQLENKDPVVIESLMLLISMRHKQYCEDAMRETVLMIERSLTDLDNLKTYAASFTSESKIANENFRFRLGIVDRNLLFHKSQGDDANFALAAQTRKELFDDLQSTIRLSREISKITTHAASTVSAVGEKLNKLRVICGKYVDPSRK